MITKLKKNKIVEVIDVSEFNFSLEHHIENVYNLVHKVIIYCEKSQEIKLLPSISKWLDKIVFFNSEKSDEGINVVGVLNKIADLSLDFDDIVCFSKSSELPDFENFEIVHEHLKFEPVILRMTEFVFNLSTTCQSRHMGSMCFFYSNILQKPNLVNDLSEYKKNIISDNYYVIDNGWNFSFFMDEEKILDYFKINQIKVDLQELQEIIKRNIHPNYFISSSKTYLSSYNGEINFETSYLKTFTLNSENNEKILVLFNLGQRKIDSNQIQNYDRVLNFNFSFDYSLPENLLLGKVENLNIFIPEKRFYECENFKEIYCFNEIKKQLRKSQLLNQQLLEIVFYNEEIDFENKKIFRWEDFKNDSWEKNKFKFFN